MKHPTLPLDDRTKKLEKSRAISIVPEDRSPLVAPTRNVVGGTLEFQAQRPSHLGHYNT